MASYWFCNNQPKACMTSVVRGSLPPLPWGHAPITLWTGLTHSPSFPSAKVGACSLASGLPSQTKSAALSPRPTPGHTPLLSAPAAPRPSPAQSVHFASLGDLSIKRYTVLWKTPHVFPCSGKGLTPRRAPINAFCSLNTSHRLPNLAFFPR